jgi:PPM family protein phosphatase
MEPGDVHGSPLQTYFKRLMMTPESIYYLFEIGGKKRQEDYIWPVAGKANAHDKVFIVCDGAGRFSNGEIASKLICRFMAGKVLKFTEKKMSGELIKKLLIEARYLLSKYAWKQRLDTELTTTFSMIILYNQKVLASWCGDSRIYHLRGGEILFRAEDNSQNTAMACGIKADSSPIYSETRWIEDVQDGDYFLLCSKGIMESVTDDDIKLLVSQNDKGNFDMSASFRRLALKKTQGNYSMYLIRVNTGAQKRGIKSGINAIRKQTTGIVRPYFILAMTITALFIGVFYFRKARKSGPAPQYRNQTTQPVDVLRGDSVPGAIVMPATRKPILKVPDSVKNNSEKPQIPHNDNSTSIHAEEKPDQTNQTPIDLKKRVRQLLIKFTTDESCKLKITNIDLNEVFDWDLSKNDNGTIYLKPGKYSIVATSEIDKSKIKTYNFDVKSGGAHTSQNLHIRF